MGLEEEGSGGRGGMKWGERGREVGVGYPLSTPSFLPGPVCTSVSQCLRGVKALTRLHMRSLVRAFTARLSDKYQQLMWWLVSDLHYQFYASKTYSTHHGI